MIIELCYVYGITVGVIVTLQLCRVLCDCNVTPMDLGQPSLSLWLKKTIQKLCRSFIVIGLTHH